jgi:hypothetical protein
MTLPDRDTLDVYGGSKENYGPVEDTTTDRDATMANYAYANVAMMSQTATRAYVRFTTAASTPSLVLVDSNAVWGNGVSYLPALARSGTGVFTVTWPSSVTDVIDTVAHGQASHTVNLKGVRIFAEGSTAILAQGKITSANVATVYTFTLGGVANDEVGTTILVEVF